MRSVLENKRTDVKTANEIGKSFVLAAIAIWYLFAFGPRCTVVVTASTDRQVWRQFWAEVKTMWYGRKSKLRGRMMEKYLEVRKETKWFMVAFSTKDEASFEGWHNENILLIFDEAKGIPDPIWRGGERLLRGKGGIKRWLIAGTPPMAPIGEFCQVSLDPNKAANWNHLTCTGWESDNVSDEACEQARKSYGEDSPFYQSMVMGQIPELSTTTLISLRDVETAAQRTTGPGGDIEVGIDVARRGCFDDKTEILTDEGFKLFDTLRGDEKVLSLNKETAEWQGINKIHKYSFDGYMNEFDGRRGVNFCITDNHNLLAKCPRGNWRLRRFDELPGEFIIKRASGWKGSNPNKIKFVSKVFMPHGGFRIKKWEFDFVDWAAFLGWFASEGSTYRDKNGRSRVCIAQVNLKGRKKITNLLTKMGIIHSTKKDCFEFFNNPICKHLNKEIKRGAPNKIVPRYIKDAKPEVIRSFLDTFMEGDGTRRACGGGAYYSSSKKLLDGIQECLIKIGLAGKIIKKESAGSQFVIEGRTAIRQHDTYALWENAKPTDGWIVKDRVKKIRYKGFVHCVTTEPHHTIMVRRNGVCMWSGNSDETVIVIRHGFKADFHIHSGKDRTTWCVGRVKALLQGYETKKQIPIKVDDTGCGGGVTDILLAEGFMAIPINFGMKPEDPDFYFDWGTEMFAYLANIFANEPISIPDDPVLKSQLYQRTMVDYRRKANKIVLKLLSKDELRKNPDLKGMKSPDRADALALAFSPIPLPRDEDARVGTTALIGGMKGWIT